MAATGVFEEWNTYAQRIKLKNRDVDLDSIIKDAEHKIVALTGIRRSGKSSLLMLLLQRLNGENQKAAYINAEDTRLRNTPNILDEALRWFGDEGYLLIDEVTNAQDWEGWLARNHELLQGRLHLIVTSSRRGLSEPSRPLRGRILQIEVYPLSFREFLDFKGIAPEKTTAGRGKTQRILEEYVIYGGYPEIALSDNPTDKIRILGSYFQNIVSLDIAEASRIEVSLVETLTRYMVDTPNFSATKAHNYVKSLGYKVGKETILSLQGYAESGYLFLFTNIFSYKVKDRLLYPRHCYCGDTGFHYAITGRVDLGRLYEGVVMIELRRRLKPGEALHYWKNKESEIDFIITRGTAATRAIQVSTDIHEARTLRRELDAFERCKEDVNPAEIQLLTLTPEHAGTPNSDIVVSHLVDWLLGERHSS
jgi:predicted AAA+ superfamily ATPase